jgi:hypothetical protein
MGDIDIFICQFRTSVIEREVLQMFPPSMAVSLRECRIYRHEIFSDSSVCETAKQSWQASRSSFMAF